MRPPILIICALAVACSASDPQEKTEKKSGDDVNWEGNGAPPELPDETTTLLGARIRRLTNSEYDAAVFELLGIDTKPSSSFNQDVRQSGYARNETQVVDAILAGQYSDAAQALAREAVTSHYDRIVPCAEKTDDCGFKFIDSFGPRVYRGAFDEERRERIIEVFRAGANEGEFEIGVELVITAALQSPFFLYHIEIGPGALEATGNGPVLMAQHEIANSISFLLTGGPPDAALRAAAENWELGDADARVAQAERLLATPAAEAQLRRMIIEWVGLNGFNNKGKDAVVYPDFLDYRDSMIVETNQFIEEVLFKRDGTLQTLLGADFSVVDDKMSEFYGLSSTGVVQFDSLERRGILNHASWLAATGHGDDSGPVVRGLKLLKKVLCASVPGHAQLGVAAPFPPNDGLTSARSRIETHASEPACASCHNVIDQVGFTFENYDGMGRIRTDDNGVAVDTNGELASAASQWGVESTSGVFENSQQLINVLQDSDDVRRCFAQNVVRFAAATRVEDIEDDFVIDQQDWTKDIKGNIQQLFIAHVRDSSFPYRSPTPPIATFIDDVFQ